MRQPWKTLDMRESVVGLKDLSESCSISLFAMMRAELTGLPEEHPLGTLLSVTSSAARGWARFFLVLIMSGDLTCMVKVGNTDHCAKSLSMAIQGCCHLVAGSDHPKVTGHVVPAGKFYIKIKIPPRSKLQLGVNSIACR